MGVGVSKPRRLSALRNSGDKPREEKDTKYLKNQGCALALLSRGNVPDAVGALGKFVAVEGVFVEALGLMRRAPSKRLVQ
jgi:hypothetical protein